MSNTAWTNGLKVPGQCNKLKDKPCTYIPTASHHSGNLNTSIEKRVPHDTEKADSKNISHSKSWINPNTTCGGSVSSHHNPKFQEREVLFRNLIDFFHINAPVFIRHQVLTPALNEVRDFEPSA